MGYLVEGIQAENMSANYRIVVTGEAGLTGCTLQERLLSDRREAAAVTSFGHSYPSWLASTSRLMARNVPVRQVLPQLLRSVTSGRAFKPLRDEFEVHAVRRKFDHLHREVGR